MSTTVFEFEPASPLHVKVCGSVLSPFVPFDAFYAWSSAAPVTVISALMSMLGVSTNAYRSSAWPLTSS